MRVLSVCGCKAGCGPDCGTDCGIVVLAITDSQLWLEEEPEDVLESPELLNPGQCNYLAILNTISLQIE